MVTTASKIKHTFVPRARGSLFIKSGTISSSTFHPSELKKTTEVFETTVSDSDESIDIENVDNYELDDNEYDAHLSPLDKSIISFVKITSSIYGFVLACIILAVWVIIGIVYKAPDNWQIVMQDGQSIQSYIWDTLLMRQQLDDNNSFLVLYGRLKSRSATHKRILKNIRDDGSALYVDEKYKDVENLSKLKAEDYFSKFSTAVGHVLGSLPAVTIYWAGVFAWIGCGALYSSSGNEPPFTGNYTGANPKYARFTNAWQMYINTAVAVVILVTSVLLGNVRLRSDKFVCSQIEQINVLDCKIESLGRYITNDTIDNELVEVPPCDRRGFKKVISFYAEIIGNGIGMLFSIAVFAAWIGIGHIMQWNSNWWLIIGTYTGLMGYVDGFVLREVYQSITEYEEKKFAELISDSQTLLDLSGIDYQLEKPILKHSLGYNISHFNNMICSNQWSVVASIVTVIALICIASGLQWSETGQLICNTPTMIIEGFCLMILIQAHGWADYKRRFVVKQLSISRELLLKYYQSHKNEKSLTI